jgi:hypothetical protein
MELSPSSEAAICAATKEFPNVLRNPKIIDFARAPHWALSRARSIQSIPLHPIKNSWYRKNIFYIRKAIKN